MPFPAAESYADGDMPGKIGADAPVCIVLQPRLEIIGKGHRPQRKNRVKLAAGGGDDDRMIRYVLAKARHEIVGKNGLSAGAVRKWLAAFSRCWK